MVDAGKATVVVDADTKKLSKDMKGARKEVSKFSQSIKNMSLVSTIGWAAAGAAVTSFLKTSIQQSIAFEQRFNSFTRLVKGDADVFLSSLKTASQGTVSELQLVTAANTAILLGIRQEQLPQMLEAAQVLGAAVGRTTGEAFRDLSIGIGRQSRMILDNLGIIVDTAKAYETYAEAIGKSANALTEQEKRIAFNKAVMSGLDTTLKELEGSVTEATKATQQFSAAWENFSTRATEDFLPTLSKLAQAGTIALETFNLKDILGMVGQPGPTIAEKGGGIFQKGKSALIGAGVEAAFGGFARAGAKVDPAELGFVNEEVYENALKQAENWKVAQQELNDIIGSGKIKEVEDIMKIQGLLDDRDLAMKKGIEAVGDAFKIMANNAKQEIRSISKEFELGTVTSARGTESSTFLEFRRKAIEGGATFVEGGQEITF